MLFELGLEICVCIHCSDNGNRGGSGSGGDDCRPGIETEGKYEKAQGCLGITTGDIINTIKSMLTYHLG